MDGLENVLLKKAKGYREKEITEEFAADEEGLKLTKRKVVYKPVPPDINALKLVLEKKKSGFDEYSDDELLKEKERLLKQLKGE